MAHWAQIDENSIVTQVTVGDNNDPAGDEGYSWLVNILGGRWIKCSYNTYHGNHLLGDEPLRWTFPAIGSAYIEDLDIFIDPSPYQSWIIDKEKKYWKAPIEKPDSGLWYWDELNLQWNEIDEDNNQNEDVTYYLRVSTQR